MVVKPTLHWNLGLAEANKKHIRPLSDLLHHVNRYYEFCLILDVSQLKKYVKHKFETWILLVVITKYVRSYFRLLVDTRLIHDMWTASWLISVIRQPVCSIDFITCTPSVVSITFVKIPGEKTSKYIMEWYKLIAFFKQANTHSSSTSNCYYLRTLTIQDIPSIRKVIWLNYIHRFCDSDLLKKLQRQVVTTAVKTVHKLFVGDVFF